MDIRKFLMKKKVASAPAEKDAAPDKGKGRASASKECAKISRTHSAASLPKHTVVPAKSAEKARRTASPFFSAHASLSRSMSAPAGRPKPQPRSPSPASSSSSAPSSPRAAAEAADSSDTTSPSPDRVECGVIPLRSYPVPSGGTGRVIIAAGSVIDFVGDGHRAAIVNAANERGLGGGGVDGAMNRAGGDRLISARRALPVLDNYGTRIPTGSARCGTKPFCSRNALPLPNSPRTPNRHPAEILDRPAGRVPKFWPSLARWLPDFLEFVAPPQMVCPYFTCPLHPTSRPQGDRRRGPTGRHSRPRRRACL